MITSSRPDSALLAEKQPFQARIASVQIGSSWPDHGFRLSLPFLDVPIQE